MEPCTLITGSTSEIGLQIAATLSERNRLILHGRNVEKLASALQRCNKVHNHVIWTQDFADVDSIESSLQKFMVENDVSVRNIVHAAGMFKLAPLRLITNNLLQSLMNINFFSAVAICRTLSRRSLNKGPLEAIVFISSVSSSLGVPGYAAYAASKGALDSLMSTLAVEMSPHTRVNAVLPGAIATDKLVSFARDAAEKMHPLGLGTPADVANMVAFLLSESGRWITGQKFVVDGGYSCR